MEVEPTRFLAEYGERIISNGYSIVPIVPGEKRPKGDEWQKARYDLPQLRKLIKAGQGHYGIGILTADAPLVDLDIMDEAVAKHMDDWIASNISWEAVIRVGQWPKRGIPFRSEGPFRKLLSTIFIDPNLADPNDPTKGQTRVEILGDGQQYVSRAIHPKAGTPYSYPRGGEPEVVPRHDLPLLTLTDAQAIVAEFERHVTALGWQVYRRGSGGRQDAAVDPLRLALSQARVDDLTDEQIRDKLLLIPARNDYHGWLEIGAALHHQFQGAQKGLDLWDEHSQRGDNYDPAELERKWNSFGKDEDRVAVTFRTIIEAAKAHEQKRVTEALVDIRAKLREAETEPAIREVCKEAKRQDFDLIAMNTLVHDLRAAVKRVTGNPIAESRARGMVRHEDADVAERPDWMADWYYASRDALFYNSKTRLYLTTGAFNANYDRMLLSRLDRLEGKAIPDTRAAEVALNLHELTAVAGVIYMPGEDEVFTLDGQQVVNGFNPASIPGMPETLSERDRVMIGRFKRHLEHMIENPRDRATFLAWYAHTPRTMKRVAWSVLLQGTEGDGKSFFLTLMAAMLGAPNVRMINAKTIQTDFNDYADAGLFAAIEEVKLHGHNRYDVMNSLKPLITNDTIEIHPKGKKSFVAPNTKTYMLLTNFVDAIPMGEGDSRYFPIMSRWQNQDALRDFMKANPRYYTELQEVLEHGPAIRKWLLEEYEQPAWFNPRARAPHSTSRDYMIAMSKSEEQDAIDDVLEESLAPGLSRKLLSTELLKNAMLDRGVMLPPTTALNRILAGIGFLQLGKVRVGDKVHRFWSQDPAPFRGADGKVNGLKVRSTLEEDDI